MRYVTRRCVAEFWNVMKALTDLGIAEKEDFQMTEIGGAVDGFGEQRTVIYSKTETYNLQGRTFKFTSFGTLDPEMEYDLEGLKVLREVLRENKERLLKEKRIFRGYLNRVMDYIERRVGE